MKSVVNFHCLNLKSGENHHIIPRSIRPDLIKDKSNIVKLTYREHYIAHWLLTKIYTKGKEHQSMVSAFYLFHSFNKRKDYFNSRAYETNREEWCILNGKMHKGQTPWNKNIKECYSKETLEKLSKSLKGKWSWMKGKQHTEEAKQKNREAHFGKKMSEECREKHSIIAKGKLWWTNGEICKMSRECPGEGWVNGRK